MEYDTNFMVMETEMRYLCTIEQLKQGSYKVVYVQKKNKTLLIPNRVLQVV